MTIRINALILLLLLALPLSAIAMGTTDNPKAELQALITAAKKEVTAMPAWQKGARSANMNGLADHLDKRQL